MRENGRQEKKQKEIDSKMTIDIDLDKGTVSQRIDEVDPDSHFSAMNE